MDSGRGPAGPWRIVVAVLVLAGLAGPGLAHGLRVFATVEGKAIVGEAYYLGGGRARNVKVAVLGPGGVRLGETVTDDQGAFTFAPVRRCDHRFVVDTGDGHLGEHTVPAAELPGDVPAAVQDDAAGHAEHALARRIGALERKIDSYRRSVRLHDVVGGIGYIVGVMGLIAFLKTRPARRRAKE